MTKHLLFGLLSATVLLAGCTQKPAVHPTDEPFRSVYHHTPEANWMNDPNGMFYDEANGRTYDAVGNIGILMEQFRQPVHVRSMWVKDAAEHGYDQPLKDYKAACLDAASKGTVMVSPFISRYEQEVLHALLHDNRYIIYLSDNGFGNFFKPSDLLFDAVAAGRVLILSPWEYDPSKHHVTRPECVAMNQMAEEICHALST